MKKQLLKTINNNVEIWNTDKPNEFVCIKDKKEHLYYGMDFKSKLDNEPIVNQIDIVLREYYQYYLMLNSLKMNKLIEFLWRDFKIELHKRTKTYWEIELSNNRNLKNDCSIKCLTVNNVGDKIKYLDNVTFKVVIYDNHEYDCMTSTSQHF